MSDTNFPPLADRPEEFSELDDVGVSAEVLNIVSTLQERYLDADAYLELAQCCLAVVSGDLDVFHAGETIEEITSKLSPMIRLETASDIIEAVRLQLSGEDTEEEGQIG